MLSFQKLYEEAQEGAVDSSAASLVIIKRGINQGLHRFRALLNREYITQRRTFSLVASQQYYQMPEEAIRPNSLTITVGSIAYPLQFIEDDEQWRLLNARANQTSDIPEFAYVRGQDEIGIWPIPTSNLSSGAELVYEARQRDLSQDDYTTGTVSVTQDSATVTGSGTTFTASMVGRSFKVNDGSPDGLWVRIASFTDATHVVLENVYEGNSGSGKAYIIGEVPDVPEEYQLALVDFALWRYYLRRRDTKIAKDYKDAFDEALALAKTTYSMKTGNQVIRRPVVRHNALFTREPDLATGS